LDSNIPDGNGPDFRLLFERSPELYLVLLPDLSITAVTDAYARATMTVREEILGRNIFEVFPDNPEDPKATGTFNLRESLERAVESRSADAMAVQKYDIRKPDSEGGGFQVRYWSPVNTPVFDDHGKLAYIIHRVEDVTEFIRIKQQGSEQRRLAENLRVRADEMELEVFQRAQELQEANRKLRASNAEMNEARKAAEMAGRELEAFSYSVSHDLRAPLRSIDGFSLLLLEKHAASLDPNAKEYLHRVRASAQRMARLIDDLLELARVSHTDLSREPVNLSEIARSIAVRLQESDPARQAVITVEQDLLAQGDSRFLRIVLNNLMDNAFKFSGKVSKTRIEVGRIRENGIAAFFVRDNGAGFDPRFADKLFGTFQRLHSPNDFEGTGIGLSTVRRIINRHGGTAWAKGEPAKGATFFFTLEGVP
jgi:signal transduction histidine kinase